MYIYIIHEYNISSVYVYSTKKKIVQQPPDIIVTQTTTGPFIPKKKQFTSTIRKLIPKPWGGERSFIGLRPKQATLQQPLGCWIATAHKTTFFLVQEQLNTYLLTSHGITCITVAAGYLYNQFGQFMQRHRLLIAIIVEDVIKMFGNTISFYICLRHGHWMLIYHGSK